MILSKKDFKFYLEEDRKRNNVSPSRLKQLIGIVLDVETYRVWRYLKTLRTVEYYTNCRRDIIGKIIKTYNTLLLKRLGGRYGIYIPINVAGFGLRIMHLSGGGGCFLSCQKIGNYCGVNAGVLLGVKNGATPIIEDYVTLGSGCKVIGGVTIGSHTLVAPNAVVVHDVPQNSIVAGIPAKVIKTVENGIYS